MCMFRPHPHLEICPMSVLRPHPHLEICPVCVLRPRPHPHLTLPLQIVVDVEQLRDKNDGLSKMDFVS
jgi:hypothetical protein